MEKTLPFPIIELEMTNFRGFSLGNIKDVGKLNIFTGKNNTGKTSILESIYFIYEESGRVFNAIKNLRGWNYPSSLYYLFTNNDSDIKFNVKSENKTISLDISQKVTIAVSYLNTLKESFREGKFLNFKIQLNGQKKVEYQISINKKGQTASDFIISGKTLYKDIPVMFLNSCSTKKNLIEIYSNLSKSGKISELIKFLKNIYKLNDVRLLEDNGNYVLYVTINDKVTPMSVCGDGMKWSFGIGCDLISMNKGILLIDDLENFHHPSSLDNVIKLLINTLTQKDLQIFLTTHSLECIDKIIEASEEYQDYFRLHFLTKHKDKIISTVYNYNEAKESRELIGTDLRGL